MYNPSPEIRTIEYLIEMCLKKLVEMEKVDRAEIDVFWYAEFAAERLDNKGFIGAATLDRRNQPVVFLSRRLNDEGLVFTISHESVHLMQILKGDLFPGYGVTFWKGREYKSLPFNHPKYREQPWEKEAYEFQPVLFEYLQSLIQREDAEE